MGSGINQDESLSFMALRKKEIKGEMKNKAIGIIFSFPKLPSVLWRFFFNILNFL